jgi:hypothetical protein
MDGILRNPGVVRSSEWPKIYLAMIKDNSSKETTPAKPVVNEPAVIEAPKSILPWWDED